MASVKTGLSWKGYEGRDYEGYWTGAAKKHIDELEQRIAATSLQGGDTIVDIGAGFGRLGKCYVGKYRLSHMVEPASNLRDIARETFGSENVRYHDASVYALPFEGASIDAVLMVRVFHHLGEPEKALREIHRILRPGGRLVFNYSNNRNFKRIAQYLVGRADNPFRQQIAAYHPILIGYHPRFIEDLLSSIGFVIEQRYGTGISDKVVGAFPWLAKLLPSSLAGARLTGDLGIAPAIFIVARKK